MRLRRFDFANATFRPIATIVENGSAHGGSLVSDVCFPRIAALPIVSVHCHVGEVPAGYEHVPNYYGYDTHQAAAQEPPSETLGLA